ncbi:Cytochrome P450 [Dillenia turbinata]|uniref:Cytochrome P450 n=1 Tax=Dillenia turbinata TaxID=194707 RepID=A0AAN8Z1P3_9MAGN
MTPITIAIVLLLLAICSLLYLRHWTVANHRRLPPGPRALPIIGNLHILGNFPHRTLCSLSKTYGPIMSIHLGKVLAIVVSSPEVAKQFLKTHDTTFAGRPRLQAADYFSYGRKSMGFSDYGPYWRGMRKLCAVELLSSTKIESFAGMRKEEVELAVQSLKEAAAAGEVVDVSAKGNALIESMTYRTVLGRSAKDDRFKLKHVIQEAFELVGAFNLSDYVPCIKALDLQGINRRSKAIFQVMDKILDTILDEHMKNVSDNHENQKDFVDVNADGLNENYNEEEL